MDDKSEPEQKRINMTREVLETITHEDLNSIHLLETSLCATVEAVLISKKIKPQADEILFNCVKEAKIH